MTRMDAVWLSWDRHRRSEELASALDVPLHVVSRGRVKLFDPLWPAIKTLFFCMTTDRRVIIVQNPSLVLTVIAATVKIFKGYRLIQDLHSYFSLHMVRPLGVRAHVYRELSLFCLRHADLTIVTNAPLQNLINRLGGRAQVLQDRIPREPVTNPIKLKGRKNFVFICTFSEDEPVLEVIDAARLIPEDVFVYITGRRQNCRVQSLPANVSLTDFLPEPAYWNLLASADGILALTTRPHTLLCGAYESLALGKPMVMSNQEALVHYFRKGVIYVPNDAREIAGGMIGLLARQDELSQEVANFRDELMGEWQVSFDLITKIVFGSAPAAAADRRLPVGTP